MDQFNLAKRAAVSRNTIMDFEKGKRTPGANNLAAIRSALEAAGVLFVAENSDGPGVRLRKAQALDGITPDELNARNDE